MIQVSMNLVKELREKTGAGFSDCKKALNACKADIEQSVVWLKKQGLSQMAKRAGRTALEGAVASYVHTGGRIGVLVEVNTETDFAARSDVFQKFIKDLTLHITAMNPVCLSEKDMPEQLVQKQKELFKEKAKSQKKPEKLINKVVEGQMNKWKKEVCLLDQVFVRPGADESNEITVHSALAELTAQVREKIAIRRFVRYELGSHE